MLVRIVNKIKKINLDIGKYFKNLQKTIYLQRESSRILNKKNINFLVIYDNSVSPPTYGDFLYIVFIVRIICNLGKKVELLITTGKYREDWDAFSKKEKSNFIEQQKLIANHFLAGLDAKVVIADNISIIDVLNQKKNYTILMDKFARKNEPLYCNGFNFLNILMDKLPENKKINSLLSINPVRSENYHKYFQKPYVAWHLRMSEKWGLERNISNNEFGKIYSHLCTAHPACDIMIISDKAGCDYAKNLSDKLNLPCLFSKDFSDDFLGDCSLVLGANYYYQFKGGGIGVIAIFSNLPYEIRGLMIHEKRWSKKKATSWQTSEQNFINSDKLEFQVE